MTSTPQNEVLSSVSIALTGSGGSGVMTAGNMLLDAAAIAGCYGLMSRSSGPQIRGGEAAAMLRIARQPIDGLDDTFQILGAIDWLNTDRFAAEIPLTAESVVIGDPSQGDAPEAMIAPTKKRVELKMKEIGKTVPGARPNMIMLGYVAALVGLPDDAVAESVRRQLGEGSPKIEPSLAAVAAGRALAAETPYRFPLGPGGQAASRDRWLLTGNEAAGYGALAGGVRFVAAYPITPATEVLEWMSPALADLGGVLVQAEDELASINMAIGASYGGTPSLTATSGPGLSLMIEAFGLAVAAEIPLVLVDVMRAGPSTGIPTKSEQSDLNTALYGVHGDAPHVVVAPNSIGDCLRATQWAVHLAERMQVPVLVLSDQSLGQARIITDRPADIGLVGQRETAKPNGAEYRRYKITESGISPMAVPGVPDLAYTADGLEHNERGTPSSQEKDHTAQMDKRLRKLAAADYSKLWADVEGDGEMAVITWGSCTAPVREAMSRARQSGIKARLISMRLLSPAQPELLAQALKGVSRLLVVEQTHGRQFYRHLRAEYDLPPSVQVMARPGPLPVRPAEVFSKIVEWSKS